MPKRTGVLFALESSGLRKKPRKFKKSLRVLGKEMQMCMFMSSWLPCPRTSHSRRKEMKPNPAREAYSMALGRANVPPQHRAPWEPCKSSPLGAIHGAGTQGPREQGHPQVPESPGSAPCARAAGGPWGSAAGTHCLPALLSPGDTPRDRRSGSPAPRPWQASWHWRTATVKGVFWEDREQFSWGRALATPGRADSRPQGLGGVGALPGVK